MGRKAKGLAVAGILTLGTGALFKSVKYIQNRKKTNKEKEEEEISKRERCIKIVEEVEQVTGELYRIGIPGKEDKVNEETTEYLRKLGLLSDKESIIVTK